MSDGRVPGSGSRPVVAVFGSSEPPEGSAAWHDAHEVGRLLGEAGFAVVNGGYGGVMEASARGARAAGAPTIGITTAVFSSRPGANPYIDTVHCAPDLYDRTRRLIDAAAAFVVLPGRSGTLAELTFVWALHKAGLLGARPILLVGEVWGHLLSRLRELGLLDPEVLEITEVAATPDEAIRRLARRLGPHP